MNKVDTKIFFSKGRMECFERAFAEPVNFATVGKHHFKEMQIKSFFLNALSISYGSLQQ